MNQQFRIGDVVRCPCLSPRGEIGEAHAVVLARQADGSEWIVACAQDDGQSAHGDQFQVISAKDQELQSGASAIHATIRVDRTQTLSAATLTRTGANLNGDALKSLLKRWARLQTRAYYEAVHAPAARAPFIPGQGRVNYGGRVFDEREMLNLIDSSLDFWLTTGSYAARFERELARKLGVPRCLLVNSGSSANLLAFMALTSPKLGERAIGRGDEVITVAAGFPTTVAPLIQFGAEPVFVDVSLPTYNVNCDLLEEALGPKTKAVMIAHTLGNPFDLKRVSEFCRKHGLWLIEDNCDALGSRYQLDGRWHATGTIGHIGTSSFYPPHHMTMGEGGAVYTRDPLLGRIMESFRDWGRDCHCPSGKDNTCNRRFEQQFGELPFGYDHKYVYSHFGYNLKVTDMQAAVGCAQLEKLDDFTAARKRNWSRLRQELASLEHLFILPEATPESDPSWFGFLLTLQNNAPLSRDKVVTHLEGLGIQTRMLFAGNLLKHPCFDLMRASGRGYRVVGSLEVTDRIMSDTFWVGVYPGMTEEKLDYTIQAFHQLAERLE
ncbi:MAG: lipopolysaccharide biosynthesis protein RfbH [Magnetococcus sp. WYHC-3]